MAEVVLIAMIAAVLIGGLWGLAGLNVVYQWNRRPILRLGKYQRTLEPGLTWVNPILCASPFDVGIREVVDVLSLPNVQTHDNVRVNLRVATTAVVKPENVERMVLAVTDASGAMKTRAIAAVMEVVSRSTLDRVLADRAGVCEEARTALASSIAHWGIDVLALEITDYAIADATIEQAIAMKARAEKEAQAELKRAEMQLQIAGKLKEAAAALDAGGWRLKTLETLIELCRSAQNNTILLPADLAQFVTALSTRHAA